MARPALSAARGLDIIDLLATSPARSLTLSDIVRASGINVASCHAVLNVLVERGYLSRDAATKAYALGPAIYGAGQAALDAQPLLAQATAAARVLFDELRIPVSLTAAVGREIVGVVSLNDQSGRRPLLRAGERRERIPPIGAPFVAWSGEEAIAEWLAASPDRSGEAIARLRRGVDTIRDRGFEVLLRSSPGPASASPAASELLALAGQTVHLGPNMALPERINPVARYDVTMIAAPVFDRNGTGVYSLCLGPFPELLPGARVLELADRLLKACVEVMHCARA
ncbi:MAG: helix-turn-helix domain-containing protein [Novosphingobium sp.]